MPSANEKQVGGKHYQQQKIQHWDYVAANDLDYFQGQITKYVSRWKSKNGVEDLKKALHFLEKYIELVEGGAYTRKIVVNGAANPETLRAIQDEMNKNMPYLQGIVGGSICMNCMGGQHNEKSSNPSCCCPCHAGQ